MLRIRFIGLFFVLYAASVSLGGGLAWAQPSACGDEQLVCESDEKCCEHQVAIFCENQACSTVRTEGLCVAKEKSCDDYWCGNRHCQSNWLLSKDVCCVYYQPGDAPEYACTGSELSCPGNTARVTIRPATAPTLVSSEL